MALPFSPQICLLVRVQQPQSHAVFPLDGENSGLEQSLAILQGLVCPRESTCHIPKAKLFGQKPASKAKPK